MQEQFKRGSSFGYQEKWLGDDGYWYKRDRFGCESEVEVIVSEFLRDCGERDFVFYERVSSDLCRSLDFTVLDSGEELLFRTFNQLLDDLGVSVKELKHVSRLSIQEKLDFQVGIFVRMGFEEGYVRAEFSRMLTLDKIILNGDRHWNNYGALFDSFGRPYKLLFLFDFGGGLMTLSRSGVDREGLAVAKRKVKARTISSSFAYQVRACGRYSFAVSEGFLAWLKDRGSFEALLFRVELLRYLKEK